MENKFVDQAKRFDLRTENISLYEIRRRLAKGYPTRDIVAFQDLQGNLGICMTPELCALINYTEGRISIDDVPYEDITDKGYVETISFTLQTVKPSQYLDFHFEVYNA